MNSDGDDTTVVIDQDSAFDALGMDPGALDLGHLLAAVIGAASIDEDYSPIPRGDVLRSDQANISSTVFVQWHLVSVNNPNEVVLFGGMKNLTTGSVAGGDNRFLFVEQFLAQTGVETRIVRPIASTDPTATGLVDQYEAMIQGADTSAFTIPKTSSQSPCSLIGMQALD
ncbi:hypothetical protein B0H14DRAFT_3441369 [Mycena olivaceomarginata]|nr:hypothetical protein B0H14DRAFT_3441369 [Mycena olivaceomarginata]